MAKGNMVLTLVAQTKKWASGLKKASQDAVTFGSVVKNVGRAVSTAFLGIAGAVLLFLPNFIKMGEEARKSERRLKQIADNTGLFEENLDGVTTKISEYAERLSFLTGVDDELIRGNQAILLTFSNLADSADEMGGPFDRAVQALLDLEAAGKNISATQLGRALQDPAKNMTALRKAGILLTDEQKELIATYMEANDVLKAQDVLLDVIEGQVGGTAEATASATERMSARFEDLVETLSDSLLPSVDLLADKFSNWLDSEEGKKAVDDLAKSFEDFGKWLASPEGEAAIEDLWNTMKNLGIAAREVGNFVRDATGALKDLGKWMNKPEQWWVQLLFSGNLGGYIGTSINSLLTTDHSNTGNDIPVPRFDRSPRVTVNFNAPVDSVSAGREVARVLSDYNRARGMG